LDQCPHLLTGEVLDGAYELSAADAGQHVRAVVGRALMKPARMPGRGLAAHDDVTRHLSVADVWQGDLFDACAEIAQDVDRVAHEAIHLGFDDLEKVFAWK